MNIIKSIKPDDKILLRDGFTNEIGTAYGKTETRFGVELRVKVGDGNITHFRSVSSVEPMGKTQKIGAYKI